ncbi:response regulator transcription factor [Streptomyces sp. NBC_00996]|uniref:response regulator transcription factor n=1 Tax=Streptomyces sp. NBC_00996 TaxID=2903710 RepID=UPI003864D653|nr:response regulator transcription factor [Streptomyces sp. NBC_00996]
MHTLLVEDDDRLAHALATALSVHGYVVRRVSRGQDALRLIHGAEFVLLDLGLPDLDGLELLRRFRALTDVPLIVVTARDGQRDIVQGLRAGADDYLVKPFHMVELMARIDAVRRRAPGRPPHAAGGTQQEGTVHIGDVEIDLTGRTVRVAGEPVHLTRREFDVLAILAEHPGEARSRAEILDRAWGDTLLSASRSLDVHVSGIRAKTGRPGLVSTVHAFGYRLSTGELGSLPAHETSETPWPADC